MTKYHSIELPVYTHLARDFQAYKSCLKSIETNKEWADNWMESIEETVKDYLPHYSGIDGDVVFDFEKSTPNKLVIHFDYHGMDEFGYYLDWTNYTLIIEPSLTFDFTLKIKGKDYNGNKEYFYQIFDEALRKVC